MKQKQTNPAVVAVLLAAIALLVGGVAFSLYQASNHSLGETSDYVPAQDPQMQELRKKAGIKD